MYKIHRIFFGYESKQMPNALTPSEAALSKSPGKHSNENNQLRGQRPELFNAQKVSSWIKMERHKKKEVPELFH